MDYNKALQFIHGTNNFSAKPGLSRIAELCNKLGNPQNNLKFIHVAGTNGKGSTVTMIACALEDAGFKVGKFTSPYVFDFRERIEINGHMIEKDELVKHTKTVMDIAEQMNEKPTEFEIVTAIGFLYFKDQNCDYVVLEVGLGGKFDATNIIEKPEVSVICSISLDHTHILGETEEKIATEKAGIIKADCPCVIYCQNSEKVTQVFKDTCKYLGSPLYTANTQNLKTLTSKDDKNAFDYNGMRFNMTLLGKHQIYNALNAICALEVLKIDSKHIISGINRAKAHARYEVISQKPRVIVDAGHNRDGIEQLLKTLKTDKKVGDITVIFGMVKDKAYQYAIREIASVAKTMICLKPDSPRALSSFDMKNIAEMFCTDCHAYENPTDAVTHAVKKAGKTGTILVCGSFYIIENVVKELNILL